MASVSRKLVEPLLSNASGCGAVKPKRFLSKPLRRKLRHSRSAPKLDHEMNAGINLDKNGIRKLGAIQKYNKFPVVLVGLVLVVYLGVGMVCFYAMEKDLVGLRTYSFIDALYFCIVTMTTVGYGDLVPGGVMGKLFICAFVFTGFGLMAWLLGSAADFLVERQEALLIRAFYGKNQQGGLHSNASHIQSVQLKVAISGTLFVLLFAVGLVTMMKAEGMNFVDAFYCVCVTVTTLGYGDVSFQSSKGRAFAILWILLSTINVAQLYLYIAELYTEGRRHNLVKWVLTRQTTSSDLEAADIDDDGVVSVAEFIVYKLKEMGKIEEEDIVEILHEFESLDIDNSGTLSSTDLKLSGT